VTTLIVPEHDVKPWPTLGPYVCRFLEERSVFGPGSLKGLPYKLDREKRLAVYKAYEIYPRGHAWAGRRRFQRVGISWRKGTAKTEWAAQIAFVELHPDGPVRFAGWKDDGTPKQGRPVRDPYIPLMAYTEDQTEELAYGALRVICSEGPDADFFDIGLDRILRIDVHGYPDGKAVAVAGSPNAADGARTTFQHFDEPLALDTPVPTPGGWRQLGELTEGDYVYGRDGREVRVLGHSPIHVNRHCYRVTFENGASVVTDGSHRWKVIDWANQPRGEQVVTTQQMFDRGMDTGYGKRWRLPRNQGFDGTTDYLRIDPYLFGLWLGDGATDAGYIHSAEADYCEIASDFRHTKSTARPGLVRWLPINLRMKLRSLGVLGNKRIPRAYMFADRQQRMDLLAGLMDSDGHTTRQGNCTFVSYKYSFAEQVAVLIRSLGCQATLVVQYDSRSRTGEMWKVHFSPSFCPFRLSRKAKAADWRVRRSTTRPAIITIDPVDSVPVRCIAVDSNDHLFLVGRGLHLTHNTHRMDLPRLVRAHGTMLENLPKRPLDDPWALETTTAGRPGGGSVAEVTHKEALAIQRGEIKDPTLFYFHREASAKHNLKTLEGRIEAVREATGPAGEYAPGQFAGIARGYDRPGVDKTYWERVWTNRWTRSDSQAFDVDKFEKLGDVQKSIPPGALCTLGFDGARFRDSTGIVLTEVATGFQEPFGLWERPENADADWQVPEDDVLQAFSDAFDDYEIWRGYFDPPHWQEEVGKLAGERPDQVVEWWTHRRRPMAQAVRAFKEGIDSGQLTHNGDPDYVRHVGNAGRQETNLLDEEGNRIVILMKIRPEAKFDLCMAGVLSWQARLDALAAGAGPTETFIPYRIR
jgi:hypothetical protein